MATVSPQLSHVWSPRKTHNLRSIEGGESQDMENFQFEDFGNLAGMVRKHGNNGFNRDIGFEEYHGYW